MLRSLLFSGDAQTASLLARAFKDLEVEFTHCAELARALSEIQAHRYDAILIDDAVEGALAFLDELTARPGSGKSLRIVLAGGQPLESRLKDCTHVVLYKPLTPERARTGLRAVRNLMSRERRRGTERVSAIFPAWISPRHARGASRQVLIADLSASGAAIHCVPEDLPGTSLVNLEFNLPGSPDPIHATAELVWQEKEGSAGFRFVDMPSSERRRLTDWVKQKQAEGSAASSAASRRARSARAGLR
jgi:hypothetical protein